MSRALAGLAAVCFAVALVLTVASAGVSGRVTQGLLLGGLAALSGAHAA